jgi:hypothetical protein
MIALTAETTGTTLTCSATNNAGLANSVSVTIKIDNTKPSLTIPASLKFEAMGQSGSAVDYSASAADAMAGPLPVSCSPLSGSQFPIGTTTVYCSATDPAGNVTSGTFTITVEDTTPPTITSHADMVVETRLKSGAFVSYTSPHSFDLVDGAGTAVCSPASGSFFWMGDTQVTCVAMDSSGNHTASTFTVFVDRVVPSSGSQPRSAVSNGSLIGSEVIDLDCDSVFWAYGIRLGFTKLCDHQLKILEISAQNLPAELTDGFSLIIGLDVEIMMGGQEIGTLPDGSSLEMRFPLPRGTANQYAVLYWDGARWNESVPQAGADHLSFTTDKTGIFVLVQK